MTQQIGNTTGIMPMYFWPNRTTNNVAK